MYSYTTKRARRESATGSTIGSERNLSSSLLGVDDESICSGDTARVLTPWSPLAGVVAGVSHMAERDGRSIRRTMFAAAIGVYLTSGIAFAEPAVGDETTT